MVNRSDATLSFRNRLNPPLSRGRSTSFAPGSLRPSPHPGREDEERTVSLQAMDWALRRLRGLSPTQKLILICLGNPAGPDGKCWPSQSVISEYTELSRETINRNLLELEKKGIIRSVKRRDPAGRDLSKIYLLNLAMSGTTQDHTYENQEPSERKQENTVKMLGVTQNHPDWTIHRGRRRP